MTKRQVERMQATYDRDPIGTLTSALRIALDAPDATWAELLTDPAIGGRRAAALRAGDVTALDDLFTDLNELRSVGP